MIQFKEFKDVEMYRKDIGITQRKVSEICGFSRSAYYYYSSGLITPKESLMSHINIKMNEYIEKAVNKKVSK